MAPIYGTTPGPQSELGHAWLPPQIVQIHPAIQPLPAKAPRPTACNVFLHGIFEKYVLVTTYRKTGKIIV